MMLAGIPAADDAVLELARLLDDAELADRLARAVGDRVRILALTIAEREMILRALDDPPVGLVEPRAVLLAEHVGRRRDGLT